MKLDPGTIESVQERMNAIKARGKEGFFTNYFRQELAGSVVLNAVTERTILFANNEHDFFRLFYFTIDLADFETALAGLEFRGDMAASYLDKSSDERICEIFRRAGFENIAVYQRMTHTKLPARPANASLEFATPKDADQIHQDLLRTFNKFTDHIPTKERLAEFVARQQVIVNRHGGRVLGAVVFQILGRQVNYNYLYNFSPDSQDTLRLQSNFYGVINQRGIRSGFLWVDSTNRGVIRMHQAFGWKFDGLKDHFFWKHFAV